LPLSFCPLNERLDTRLTDDLKNSVCFLCVKDQTGPFRYGGTGFFVSVPSEQLANRRYIYIVTARHCIASAKTEGHHKLHLRINTTEGAAMFECDANEWIEHEAGVVAFLATVIGYGCSTVFFLCAFLKPMFPSRIGLWLASRHTVCFGYWNGHLSGTELYGISVRPPASFVLGTLGPTDGPVRELLGAWLSPLGVLCGVLSFLVTSLIARWLIRRFSQNKEWSASLAYTKSPAAS
jgi:hypothetical protein